MNEETKIYFYKGSDNVIQKTSIPDSSPIDRIQKSFEKVLDGKNLSFLLGSGCSSYLGKKKEKVEKIELDTESKQEPDLDDLIGIDTEPKQEPDLDDFFDLVIPETQGEISHNEVVDDKNNKEISKDASFWEFEEIGIPTMKPLAKKFFNEILSFEECKKLKSILGIDVTTEKFSSNLEYFLGSLHSCQFFEESISKSPNGNDKQSLKTINQGSDKKEPLIESKQENLTDTTNVAENNEQENNERLFLIQKTIEQVKHFLIDEILNESNRSRIDDPVNNLYEKFYRKLLYRNTNLPKPNIFTTNYDLYSETALDRLWIHYVNGFSGGIRKYFNPTIFNYALAERMDLSQNKWGVIDNFFYLYKIHGSINWIQDEDGSKLFKVREIQETAPEVLKGKETVMIHPTPLKHNASLGSPYSDLFREFQKKLMQNNNILVTIGYSFSDEHINNLIYQAFTIPSFRLIVLGSPSLGSEIEKLRLLNDPRIWIIGGELEYGKKLHYFEGFVDSILPDLTNDEIDDKIENAIRTLFKRNEQGR